MKAPILLAIKQVEVKIEDNNTVYVNIDGVCALRINCKPGTEVRLADTRGQAVVKYLVLCGDPEGDEGVVQVTSEFSKLGLLHQADLLKDWLECIQCKYDMALLGYHEELRKEHNKRS